MDRDNLGVCYVAWGQKHVAEAAVSAATSQFPTCLFVDPGTPVPDGRFSLIRRTSFQEFDSLHPYYRKLAAMRDTPFDVTLFADSDTQFIGSVELGFERARRFGFAAVLSPGGVFHWNDEGKVREYLHFNGGTLWFAGQPVEWVEKVKEFGRIVTNNDEPAWAMAWDALGINPAILPATFNHVAECNLHARKIRVWHGRCPVAYSHLTGTPSMA